VKHLLTTYGWVNMHYHVEKVSFRGMQFYYSGCTHPICTITLKRLVLGACNFITLVVLTHTAALMSFMMGEWI